MRHHWIPVCIHSAPYSLSLNNSEYLKERQLVQGCTMQVSVYKPESEKCQTGRCMAAPTCLALPCSYFLGLVIGIQKVPRLLYHGLGTSVVGEGGFEPPKALPADLQSVPFGHSGIPPYSFRSGWSWWTDSNPRPADYKSAALPTELHQHRTGLTIIANRPQIVKYLFQQKYNIKTVETSRFFSVE